MNGTSILEAPCTPKVAKELEMFWTYIFGELPDVPRDVYLGSEIKYNRFSVFVERDTDTLVSTCTLTVPNDVPSLSDLGSVATHPDYRNLGIFTRLCGEAVERFFADGGQAIFIGSVVPAAIKALERSGGRKVPGSQWLAIAENGDTPRDFLVNYFEQPFKTLTIRCNSPADRVVMIPLILSPHPWHILDANVSIPSSQHHIVASYTFYLRYTKAITDLGGKWFTASTDDGRIVGISTARPARDDSWSVDGFTQFWYSDCWTTLVDKAVRFAFDGGAKICYADVGLEDYGKTALFEAIDFQRIGSGRIIKFGNNEFNSIRLARKMSA